jgi:hypothetical protein
MGRFRWEIFKQVDGSGVGSDRIRRLLQELPPMLNHAACAAHDCALSAVKRKVL